MKFLAPFLAALALVSASPVAKSPVDVLSTLRQRRERGVTKALASPLDRRDTGPVPRMIVYVQTFHDTSGNPLSLLPLIEEDTGITHIILASFHLNEDPGDIHLNDNPPSDPMFDQLWTEVPQLQAAGVKVMAMVGGWGDTSLNRLNSSFDSYYPPLLAMLQQYNLDGLDQDIEVAVDISTPLLLLNSLYNDMGAAFIQTFAPVASALASPSGGDLSGFSYFDLDAQAVAPDGSKLVSWYNGQFYSGFGTASNPYTYEVIINAGWTPDRVVMGVLDNSGDGSGWVNLSTLESTIKTLHSMYSNFGGVDGWEYWDAGSADGLAEPWMWVQDVDQSLTQTSGRRHKSNHTLTLADLPFPHNPFSSSALTAVEALGATHYQALRALNSTRGNVDAAKALYLNVTETYY